MAKPEIVAPQGTSTHHVAVPRRTRDLLYAGALGLIDAARISRLGPNYVLQPKRDGIYALVSTDRTGQVANILMRSGEPIPPHVAPFFRGIRWAPDCVLVAELEVFTEASDRLAESRGYRVGHVFDAIRVNGRGVSSLPQQARRDEIMRALEQLDDDKPWRDDEKRTARRPDGPWTKRIPNGHRRLPVVPQLPVSAYDQAMAEWVDSGDAEGLVVVAQEAPIGKTGAKRKHKTVDALDCVIVNRDKYAAILAWKHGWFTTSCTGQKWSELKSGDVVEVMHNGWEQRGSRPKFPRIKRARPDLSALSVCPLWESWPWEMSSQAGLQ